MNTEIMKKILSDKTYKLMLEELNEKELEKLQIDLINLIERHI